MSDVSKPQSCCRSAANQWSRNLRLQLPKRSLRIPLRSSCPRLLSFRKVFWEAFNKLLQWQLRKRVRVVRHTSPAPASSAALQQAECFSIGSGLQDGVLHNEGSKECKTHLSTFIFDSRLREFAQSSKQSWAGVPMMAVAKPAQSHCFMAIRLPSASMLKSQEPS